MKIKTVKILGKIFKVEYVPPNHSLLEISDSCGMIYFSQSTIYISDKLSKQSVHEVILHEMIHGLEVALGINLSEEDVKRLGEGFLALIVDNSKLFMEIIDGKDIYDDEAQRVRKKRGRKDN